MFRFPKLSWVLAAAAAVALAIPTLTASAANEGVNNAARRDPYYNNLKGKRVVFVPLAMGFDLTEGWAAIMRRQAKDLGYKFEFAIPTGAPKPERGRLPR